MKYTGPMTADIGFHIGFVTKKEDDPRRHKSRCIHIQDGKCMCGKLRCYTYKCPGSAHCSQYSETNPDMTALTSEATKISEEEKAKKKRELAIFKAKNIPRIRFLDRSFDDLFLCPVCSTRLNAVNGNHNLKVCKYCTSRFVKVHQGTETDADTEAFMIMEKQNIYKRNKQTSWTQTYRPGSACKWNSKGICENSKSSECGSKCYQCNKYIIDVTKKSVSIAMKSPT